MGALAIAIAIGIGMTSAGAAAAQTPRPIRSVGQDLVHVGEDVVHVWTSPLRGTGRDWLGVAGVGAAFALLMPIDDEVDAWAVRDSASTFFKALKPFRHGGVLYKGNSVVPLAAGLYIAGVAFDNRALRDGPMGCVASYVSTTVPRKLLYRAVGRDRPLIAEGDQYRWRVPGTPGGKATVEDGWYDNSFPGGHFANLMSCAAFLGNRFEMGYAEPVVYAIALAVGVGRIADRGHWLSDQAAGAALGYAAGRTVAIRQLKREEARRQRATQQSSAMVPQPEGLFVTPTSDGWMIGWSSSF